MVHKPFRLMIVVMAALQLAGCYTDYGPVEVQTLPVSPSAGGAASVLQAGERLKVTVYGEESLTGEYDISPGGTLTMPLVGTVRAVGRSQSELARDVERKYRAGGFLQDPHVTVVVAQFKPFYVLGEVSTPGEYPFRSNLSVHSAVAMAGGFTYRASRSYVLIRHVGDDVWREYSLTEAVPIVPGDLIRVPERYF